MSGGVDSSVAAALLLEKGYDVTGAFMINYEEDSSDCWLSDYRDATRVAAKLGIQLLKLNFTKEYERDVLDYMYKEYEKGITPNPDVLCNKYIKFGAWMEKARELGFSKLATGHYASTKDGKLIMAKDENKDQTYFLHQLNKEQLSQAIFPLGEFTKKEVRELAKKYDLPTAEKEESMGICFVGEVNMKDFLQKKIKLKKGKIVMSNGEEVGEHDGLSFYTIGQRHINTQGRKKPLYLVGKDFEKNELIVGYEDDPLLYKTEVEIKDMNWISGESPSFPLEC